MIYTAYNIEYYSAQVRRITEHREAGAEEEIRKLYRELLRELKSDLGKLYADNADESGVIDYARLQQKARYANFLELVEKRVNIFSPKIKEEITTTVQNTYKRAYKGLINAVKKSKNINKLSKTLESVQGVTPEMVKRAVQNPINGLTLNDILEKNRKSVLYDIKQVINIGLINNDHISTISKKLTEKVDMDYRKATRIVRTETHRVQEAGNHDAAAEVNGMLEKSNNADVFMVKIWHNMGDERVRPQRPAYKRKKGVKARKTHTAGLRSMLSGANHLKMEGQMVKASKKFDLGDGVKADCPGSSGVAAHDINCRCFVEYDLMTAEAFARAVRQKKKPPEVKNYKFTPAKTIKEAEEYGKKFAETVSFDGATNIDAVNSVNETLERLTTKYPIERLKCLLTDKDMWEGMYAGSNYEVLKIKTKYLNDNLKTDNIMTRAQDEAMLKLWKNTLKNKKYNQADLEKQIADLTEALKYKRRGVPETVSDVITHEFGHILSDQYIGLGANGLLNLSRDEWIKAGTKVWKVFERAKKNGDIYNISKYANQNVIEFFAEVFTMYEKNEKLPKYIKNMVEGVINGGRL